MIGRKLSHYEVVEPLGAGGMGQVYRARDLRLGRDVAIKILPPDRTRDETSRRRFQREAMAASSLNHPNIITIYEINSEDDTDFIAMECVHGSTLSSRIRRGPLGLDEAVDYASQIADALVKAHAAGIVHRDLKPGNVMITDDGLVKVLDFGLAKFDMSSVNTQTGTGEQQLDLTVTTPGAVTGTVAYMSPEQARGDHVDSRSDVFSFGIVLFEMLSGQLPFMGPNTIAILHNIHFSPPRNLLELRRDAPPPLVALVNQMLEKPPEQRPSTAEIATMLHAGTRATGISAATWQSAGVPAAFTATSVSTTTQAGTKAAKWGMRATAALLFLAVLSAGYFFKMRPRAVADTDAAANGTTVTVPDEPFALRSQAQAYLERWDVPNNLDRATAMLNRALELDRNYAPAYASLTFAYFEKNRLNPDKQWTRQAEGVAQKAMELNPDLTDSQLASGVAAMMSGHSAEAEKAFRKAEEIEPKSTKPHFWLGFLFNSLDKSKEAEEELNRALTLNPNDWHARMNLGLLFYKAAKYSEAATEWEKVSKLTPQNTTVLGNLAAVYQQMDRNEEAASVLQRSLEIKPDADTYSNLGTLMFFQARYAESVPLFEKAVAIGANNYIFWGNLGDAYRWAPGRADKSSSAYTTAIRLANEELASHAHNMDARIHLALYLAKSGNKNDALREVSVVDNAQQNDAEELFLSAVVHEISGERDRALAMLSGAVKAGYGLGEIEHEPELQSLRADPRYHALIASQPGR
jgi:serine/threonine-protein kinase